MSTNIPLAREKLTAIAQGLRNGRHPEVAAFEIEAVIADLMIRSFTGRKTPAKHRRMTDEIARSVCAFARMNGNLSHEEIARHFDINAGRVSEALSGKRFRMGRAIETTENPA